MGEKGLVTYTIEFDDNKYTQAVKKDLEKEGFKLNGKKWSILLN